MLGCASVGEPVRERQHEHLIVVVQSNSNSDQQRDPLAEPHFEPGVYRDDHVDWLGYALTVADHFLQHEWLRRRNVVAYTVRIVEYAAKLQQHGVSNAEFISYGISHVIRHHIGYSNNVGSAYIVSFS